MRNGPSEYSRALAAFDVATGMGATANAQAGGMPTDPSDPFSGGQLEGIDFGDGDATAAPQPARVEEQPAAPSPEAIVVKPEDTVSEKLNRAHEIFLLNDKGEQVDIMDIPGKSSLP